MPMLVIKTSYLLTWHCILKIMQLMLGTICVGIIGNNFMDHHFPYSNPQNFFLIVTTTFYINTLILFISYLFSSSAPVIRKTNYEFLCNATTCVLFLTASIAVLVQINKKNYYYYNYKALLAASIFGLLNSMLYLCNAVFDYDIQMKNQENA
ncbi:PREDICTED: uncharacterized protein LOC105561037 [Vollenhovia emeryi]|uniref:uncharacterized protein LOC105561037 n=1 Tax=Vollenhovia emeryi TaxID=411798 RepID=UPI0005F412A3|nr:PREDICTED: uncharacterized protein LOC105561037 [Vollenhovia emeryi]XP_011866066.1 PREDICTED: uncharacterized protein LOC105561037 [Vollenhovia emeryi]